MSEGRGNDKNFQLRTREFLDAAIEDCLNKSVPAESACRSLCRSICSLPAPSSASWGSVVLLLGTRHLNFPLRWSLSDIVDTALIEFPLEQLALTRTSMI